ncbi:sigma-70 family RNA polymerase sigma factor [Paludisphaera mucosa]|uniref:Sigma-70 family RNA polymerase sigma factor n=1 Tax=Paludisphaera mucosa TaxID=3030827 RepID=A0ABT6FGH8_9BACT|nr:sigma-70 family RNA polymerase sigma factor [Paludisphaera mucosa]MDG3006647.1 sigma-70 family RNA polymerase sigma factor [Paludisphaera mucosa]
MAYAKSSVESDPVTRALAPDPSGPPDRRLLEAFLACDDASAESAFRRIVERHAPAVVRVCRDVLGDHHEAQDAAQAVFLVLARRAGAIERPDSLKAWLHGVSLRVARRVREGLSRRQRAEQQTAQAIAERARSSSTTSPTGHQELHEELARLPDRYRLPIVLCYFEGYTQEKAAQVLGWPYGTLQTRLHRGRKRLREALARRDPALCGTFAVMMKPLPDSPSSPSPEWVAETSRAAVRFAGSRAGGAVGIDVSDLAVATAATMEPSLSSSTIGLLVICLAVGGLWYAGRGSAPENRPPELPAPKAQPHMPPNSTEASPPAANQVRPVPAAITGRGTAGGQGPHLGLARLAASPSPVFAGNEPEPPRPTQPKIDGRELFERVWSPNDRRSHGGDGLGPVFNARSCVDCHDQGGAGGGGSTMRNIEVATAAAETPVGLDFSYGFSMNFGGAGFEYHFGYDPTAATRRNPRDSMAAAAVHPAFREASSVMLHRFGTDASYLAWRSTIPGRHGAVEVRMSQRNPTPLFGVGLIEKIPDDAILAAARRPNPNKSPRGRVSRVEGGRIGRFGWKAQSSTVADFVLAAAAGEMGLEVPGRRQADDPRQFGVPSDGVDMNREECDALVAFVADLPSPTAIVPADPRSTAEIKEGAKTFRSIGCSSCHLPKLGDVEGIYSDLLLHDMGPELGDAGNYTVFGTSRARAADRPRGVRDRADDLGSDTREWRTPPLWGLRDSSPYLHDGRAETVSQAISMHGGQGAPSADRFARLSPRRKSQLEAFLSTLAAPPDSAE